jgi:hypothetical protein
MHRHIGQACVLLGSAFVLAVIVLFIYLFVQSPLFN